MRHLRKNESRTGPACRPSTMRKGGTRALSNTRLERPTHHNLKRTPHCLFFLAVAANCAASDSPTFYKDVLPILQSRCQNCHRNGEMAPIPLQKYEQVRRLAPAIRQVAQDKKMPPWFADPHYGRFSNDPSLTANQIAILAAWADAQAPEGDAHDAPPLVNWAQGWNIEKPDVIFQMPRPMPIPAEGDVPYQYIIL